MYFIVDILVWIITGCLVETCFCSSIATTKSFKNNIDLYFGFLEVEGAGIYVVLHPANVLQDALDLFSPQYPMEETDVKISLSPSLSLPLSYTSLLLTNHSASYCSPFGFLL